MSQEKLSSLAVLFIGIDTAPKQDYDTVMKVFSNAPKIPCTFCIFNVKNNF